MHSVEFSFNNDDYNIIEEAKEDIYVKIERVVRTQPFEGMKQPTPIGGFLGLETIMNVKHRGNVGQYTWELTDGESSCFGMTGQDGLYIGLPIPIAYGSYKTFRLKISVESGEDLVGDINDRLY